MWYTEKRNALELRKERSNYYIIVTRSLTVVLLCDCKLQPTEVFSCSYCRYSHWDYNIVKTSTWNFTIPFLFASLFSCIPHTHVPSCFVASNIIFWEYSGRFHKNLFRRLNYCIDQRPIVCCSWKMALKISHQDVGHSKQLLEGKVMRRHLQPLFWFSGWKNDVCWLLTADHSEIY